MKKPVVQREKAPTHLCAETGVGTASAAAQILSHTRHRGRAGRWISRRATRFLPRGLSFLFLGQKNKAVWGINKAMETHFCLVNIQVNVQHSTFNLSQGLLLKKVAGELQATSGLHAPLLPLRRPFLKTVVVNGSQFQSSLPWFLSFLTKGLWTQPFSRLTAWLSTLLQIQQALYKRCWVSERLSCTLKFQKCRLLPVCVYRVTSVMSKSLQLHGL